MSVLVELELLRLVLDFDTLIGRCNRLGLPEVTKRLEPIRDVIQRGIELRQMVQKAQREGKGGAPAEPSDAPMRPRNDLGSASEEAQPKDGE